eukprot:1294431-Karenia_brevis.AAC.1
MCHMAILPAIQPYTAYGKATGRHQAHCTNANVIQEMDQDKKAIHTKVGKGKCRSMGCCS